MIKIVVLEDIDTTKPFDIEDTIATSKAIADADIVVSTICNFLPPVWKNKTNITNKQVENALKGLVQ